VDKSAVLQIDTYVVGSTGLTRTACIEKDKVAFPQIISIDGDAVATEYVCCIAL